MWAALDPAVITSALLGVAALVTAIGGVVVSRRDAEAARAERIRDAEAAREEAEAARAAAQSGEDDSFVNRSLKTMETSQAWLKEENASLSAVIENQRVEIATQRTEIATQRTEIGGLHQEISSLREELSTTTRVLAKCQRTCDEVTQQITELKAQLEAGR